MEIRRFEITVAASPDATGVEDIAAWAERLLGRALAIVEDELRRKFGDIDVDLDVA